MNLYLYVGAFLICIVSILFSKQWVKEQGLRPKKKKPLSKKIISLILYLTPYLNIGIALYSILAVIGILLMGDKIREMIVNEKSGLFEEVK